MERWKKRREERLSIEGGMYDVIVMTESTRKSLEALESETLIYNPN